MKNLNKHRKAITEAGYTLSKDGTQVTNKSGKTVAGTNDNGFFSGSSTLTNIFKGDTKAKGKEAKAEPKAKAPPESPNKAPRISAKPKGRNTPMTKEQARKYTSASPSGTPTLMSQGGKNAETREKGPERSGAYSVPVAKEADKVPAEPREKNLFTNAKGESLLPQGKVKPAWDEYSKMTSAEREAAGLKPMLSRRQYSGNVWK
jgi:hypothetical protein